MPEILTLTAPIAPPSTTTWRVVGFGVDVDAPSITVTFLSNMGEQKVWRLTPDTVALRDEVLTGVSFINQGKFKTVQNKSLQKWLIEQAIAHQALGAGAVGGVVD